MKPIPETSPLAGAVFQEIAMTWRTILWALLALPAAIVGYFAFAVVIALHLGAWIFGDKMALAQAPYCYLLGAVGAALGVGAVLLVRSGVRAVARLATRNRDGSASGKSGFPAERP